MDKRVLPLVAALMVSFPAWAENRHDVAAGTAEAVETIKNILPGAADRASKMPSGSPKKEEGFFDSVTRGVEDAEEEVAQESAAPVEAAETNSGEDAKEVASDKEVASEDQAEKVAETVVGEEEDLDTWRQAESAGQGIHMPMPEDSSQPPASVAAFDALSEADVQRELERQAMEAAQRLASQQAAIVAEKENRRAEINERLAGAISQPRADAPLPMPGFRSNSGGGRADMLKANVLRVVPGRNEVIAVSMVQPNRIATPFKSPQVVGILPPGLIVKPVGQSIYVQMPEDSEESVALFVTGEEEGAPVISLILAPDAVPAQTAILQLETPEPGLRARQDEADIEPETYQQRLVGYLRDGALGIVPAGMTRASLPNIVGRRGALLIRPEVRYSGSTLDFWRYRVESIADRQIELDEAAFWEKGVRAVSIMPRLRLNRGEHTTVFVISDKSVFNEAGERR